MRFHRARVLRALPHPGRGFTQGLLTDGAIVWESSGGYGQSELRRYRLGSGTLEASAALAPELFGEAICRVGGHLWQLTWQERVALRWDPDTLELLGTVPYNREGWGICAAGGYMLTSDGSSELVRRDPQTLEPLGLVLVRCGGRRVNGLNDLEWSAGRVWANVIGQRYLVGIDPDSGEVTDAADTRLPWLGGAGWLGGRGWLGGAGWLARERHWGDPEAVLNGIAALPGAGEFLLTGKTWRHLYHVRLVDSRRLPPGLEVEGHRPARVP